MKTPILLVLLFAFAVTTQAGTDSSDIVQSFYHKHQAGVRAGVWSNLGGTPGENLPSGITTGGQDFADANFYVEGFFGVRIIKGLVGEVSVGIASRGEAILREDNTNYVGNLLVYPILAKAKFYPMSGTGSAWQPYILLGGGLYHVRHDIQFATGGSGSILPFLEEASETSADFVLGGGVDRPVASMLALSLNVQYMPIKQSKALIGVDDWSSLTITVGATYLFRSTGDKENTRKGRMR